MQEKIRVAVLDMYDGTPNQGMHNLRTILNQYTDHLTADYFDVRGRAEVPDTSYDIYLSTGGPGSPHDGDGLWDRRYFKLIQDLWENNQVVGEQSRHVLFICHSFQMACIHFRIGEVIPRRSMSFGIFPAHKTTSGLKEPLLEGLPDPFYVADFRKWQVIQPDHQQLKELGAEIIALEKYRPHVPLERAIMGIRFTDHIVGFQFHPEADPVGMLKRFREVDKSNHVVNQYGEEKYQRMIDDLHDPNKMGLTHDTVLPVFMSDSIKSIKKLKTEKIEHFTV